MAGDPSPMSMDATVVSFSREEAMRIEMICMDDDKDEALAFLKDLQKKLFQISVRGMKSHLDS